MSDCVGNTSPRSQQLFFPQNRVVAAVGASRLCDPGVLN